MLVNILQGLPTTLVLTIASLGIGIVAGIPLVMLRRSRFGVLRIAARLLIELLRGIPPIVWLFIIFFGLAPLGIRLEPLPAALIGMGAISAAYLAEIYRGGLAAVHQSQYEASAALGMSKTDTMTRVIGPQVIRVSIPAVATYAIALLKDSSIAFTIGVTDMMHFAHAESRYFADALTPFLIVAAIYVVLSVFSAWGARWLDAHLRKRVAG
ncbi:amino acid ABC transporter permease [uncultured Aeromicrobium sp.]|uniref:amino acid ABC transporter permease n=1 Tax=uncultured Aeromicrobium sp. TaxID=337820 RepID=UPI0025E05A96|nr:amino acid ABC transporter permease [uncultured Aeromicrobium sp.]